MYLCFTCLFYIWHIYFNVTYLWFCHWKIVSLLVVWTTDFIHNVHEQSTHTEPVPGNFKAPHNLPQPYLTMEPNILTTKVTYQAASYPDPEMSSTEGALKYETFLTYMYERDLSEKKYWNTLIATSTLKGIRENGKSVSRCELWCLMLIQKTEVKIKAIKHKSVKALFLLFKVSGQKRVSFIAHHWN